ncbi:MAG TPA: XrtA/PEP-CTERM system exopolysaccharide export protein [Woeseiaceae bacterium]|nr:XrtA/PEP-CTERM system exopolysaccharide export protein [Woeseiaceae bacterium]
MSTHIPRILLLAAAALVLGGCASPPSLPPAEPGTTTTDRADQAEYRIGPGDMLEVFVWRNPEISATVPVRPDGKISTPLVEDMVAVGKTPSQLARDMEEVLATYIKSPSVNVIVTGFQGTFEEQVRVVGQAANPQAIPYREGMTILDVMIAVGGLGEFAAGNRAKLVRKVDGEAREYRVRLDDLLNGGDISENKVVQPGDVLIIPESFF